MSVHGGGGSPCQNRSNPLRGRARRSPYRGEEDPEAAVMGPAQGRLGFPPPARVTVVPTQRLAAERCVRPAKAAFNF
jgi:hypothetical protein